MSGTIALVLRVLLVIALYAFIGYAVFVVWRDLQRQAFQVNSRKIPSVGLSWRLDGKTVEHQFLLPEIMIGRDPSTDCVILDDTISARHARLAFHHNQWWLEDLGSTNGTFLNDEPLEIPTVIVSGDEFRCGQVNLIVTINDESTK